MSTVDEITKAISQLPPKDFARVRKWVQKKDEQEWDKQIEDDCAAGRFTPLIAEIEKDIAAGRTKPLNEIVDNA